MLFCILHCDLGVLFLFLMFVFSVKPSRIELFRPPPGGVDEGSDLTLTCEADGGKPPPIFEWYILGKTEAITAANILYIAF